MRNFAKLSQRLLRNPFGRSVSFLLSLGLTISYGTAIRAESPETAPPELKTLIAQIDAAANRQDLETVMQFYGDNFTNSDGLTYQLLQQSLGQFWKRYGDLKYTTTLESWDKEEDQLVVQTVTTIEGSEKEPGRVVKLDSTIKSRQYFQNQKMVRQEILSERTELRTGNKPPRVEINLPETVRVGEEFDFDVIVQEPLGDRVLLGAAINQKAEGDRYLKPDALDLEVLQAGGIFKRAKAPEQPEDRWLSAILVQEDGLVLITQRLKVENR
jgi:hypothetical protein